MSIYTSEWTPRGARKHWERTSVGKESAQSVFGEWCRGNVKDACGWFDERGNLRVLVADTDDGLRMTYRQTAKGVTIKSERS